jgi:hypothetical protein
MTSFIGVALAATLLLGSPTSVSASSNSSGFLPLSAATQLEKLLKCEKTYQLVADPNRVSKMKGFYCVTGLRGNFRLVKIFESKKAAKDDTDLYEPIQTGGRKLVVGGNWFVFGLPQDIKAVLNSGLIKRSDSGLGLKDYTTKQDLCMGLSTAAMESHFDDPSGEARHLHDLEWLFKGGTKHVQSAIKRFGPQLKKALLGDDGLLMGQTIARASLVYRPFCLALKDHGTK